jgi:F0F1-type ATP synthase epsilon subunit
MVLSELTQEELSDLDEEEIRQAIRTGSENVKASNSSTSSAFMASQTVRAALTELRGS